MAAVATDPTIRRQVMVAARQVLAADPGAPIEQITERAASPGPRSTGISDPAVRCSKASPTSLGLTLAPVS